MAVAALPLALASAPAKADFLCNTPDCAAPTTTVVPGLSSYGLRNTWDTRFSVGLQWNFGTMLPELVLAVRRTDTTPHNQVYGGQADISFPINLADPLQLPTVRALGLAGNRDAQGQAGIGLQLAHWAPLAAVGLQVPYASGGANYVLGQGLQPYGGVNAFSRVSAPRIISSSNPGSSTISCPSRTRLLSVASLAFQVAANAQANGQTCVGAS